MVTVECAINGLKHYVDSELIPKVSGLQKMVLAVYSSLAIENLEHEAETLIHHPAIEMLGIVSEDGRIDVEKLKTAVMQNMDEPLRISFPIVGEFRFNRDDIDRMAYMMNNG